MATHAVFSPPAVDRLFNAPISRVIVTDTLPLRPRAALREPRGPLDRHHRGQRDLGDLRGRVGLGHLRRREPALGRAAGARRARLDLLCAPPRAGRHSRSRRCPRPRCTPPPQRERGSRHARRLRLAGSIPAVVYGEGVDAAADRGRRQGVPHRRLGRAGPQLPDRPRRRRPEVPRAWRARSSVTRCAAPSRTSTSRSSTPTSRSWPRSRCTSSATPSRCATPTGRSTSRCSASKMRSPPRPDPHAHRRRHLGPQAVGGAIRVADLALPEGVVLAVDPTASVVTTHPGRVAAKPAGGGRARSRANSPPWRFGARREEPAAGTRERRS